MKSIFFVFIALFLLGCPDMGTYYSSYSIVNETKHNIELRFYKLILAGQERSFVFKVTIEGQGLVIKRTLKTYALDVDSPFEAFEADSVAVIFNKERVEGHVFIEPMSGSIINRGDYESNEAGNDYVFYLKETNYKNATPCDGSCN